jgi:hypothetical protein
MSNGSKGGLSVIFRQVLFAWTDGRCFYCGIHVRFDAEHEPYRDWLLVRGNDAMVADHGYPKTRGGKDGYANRLCSCYSCNAAKGSLSVQEFRFVKALKSRDFLFAFACEEPPDFRDWLCVYSDEAARELFVHNYPDAARYYSRGRSSRNSWWVRRK